MKCAPLLVLIVGIAFGQETPPVSPASARRSVLPTSARRVRPGTRARDASRPAAMAPEKNLCAARADPVAVGSVQWNGWGRDPFNTRYQPEPAIRAMDVPKLALEVGLRISRRQRIRPAHPGGRQTVRDEFGGTHLRTGRQERLHLLDLRCARRQPHGDLDRRAGPVEARRDPAKIEAHARAS